MRAAPIKLGTDGPKANSMSAKRMLPAALLAVQNSLHGDSSRVGPSTPFAGSAHEVGRSETTVRGEHGGRKRGSGMRANIPGKGRDAGFRAGNAPR